MKNYDPKKVQITTELITPSKAKNYLSLNKKNRKLIESISLKYARDMSNDAWEDFGNIIMLSTENIVLNGQHTLDAIVQSGKQQWLFVAKKLNPDLILSVDKGAQRKWYEDAEISDPDLSWINTSSVKSLAIPIATAGRLFSKKGKKDTFGVDLTNAEKIDILKKHKDAIQWVEEHLPVKKKGKKRYMPFQPNATTRAAIVRAWYHVNHEDLSRFCYFLINGYMEKTRPDDAIKCLTFFREDVISRATFRNGKSVLIEINRSTPGIQLMYVYTEQTLEKFISKKDVARRINQKNIFNQKKPIYTLPDDPI